MRIQSISVSHHRIPVDPPFPAAWDSRPRSTFDATVVCVESDTGLRGYGSGDAMHGFGAYASLFVGEQVDPIERHSQVLENIAFHASRCWPLDIALWDLKGKAAGQPVHTLLGGTMDKIPLYASTGSLRSPRAVAERVAQFKAQGFGAVKIRFGRGALEADLEALDAAVEAAGSDLRVMVDCNQGWRMPWDTDAPWDLERARTVALACQERGVYWMEEPLHRGDYNGMQALAAEMDMWIAGAEMTRDLHEFHPLIERHCLDVLQPDVVVSLGITGLYALGMRAKQVGILFSPHTWGNGHGLLANAHVAAAVGTAPFLEYPLDPPEWVPQVSDFFLAEPLRVEQGHLLLPQSPGLGIEVDEARLETTQIGKKETY